MKRYWFVVAALVPIIVFAGEDDILLKPLDDNPVAVAREIANQMSVIAGAIDFSVEDPIPVQLAGEQLRELLEVIRDPAQLEQIANLVPLIMAADLLGADAILDLALDIHGERIFSMEAVQRLQALRRDHRGYAEYRRVHLDALAPALQQRIIERRLRRFGLVQENVVARLVHDLPQRPRHVIDAAVVSPDGRFVATVSLQRGQGLQPPSSICFWTLNPGQNPTLLHFENPVAPLGLWLTELSFSLDGQWLVANSRSLGEVYTSNVWLVEDLAQSNTVPRLQCSAVLFSLCAGYVAALSQGEHLSRVRVWRAIDFPTDAVIFDDAVLDSRNIQVELDGVSHVVRFSRKTWDFRRGQVDGGGVCRFTSDDPRLPMHVWLHGSMGIRPSVDRHGTHYCEETLWVLSSRDANEAVTLFALYRGMRGHLQSTRDGNLMLQIRGREVHVIEVPQPQRVTTLAAAQMLHFRSVRLEATRFEETLPLHFEDAIDESPYARQLVGELPPLVRILRPLPLLGGMIAFILSRR